MGSKVKVIVITLLTAALLFTITCVVLVHAQSSADYDLTWFTVRSGGGISAGGDYCVGGTAGQPEAGALSGEGYTLAGGFWSGAGPVSAPPHYTIYLPCLLRGFGSAFQ
jgi:uncharacterized membrane protein